MDRRVGYILGPGTVLDVMVGGVVAGYQAERRLNGPLPHHHMADAALDFSGQAGFTGVACVPLGGVAVGLHEGPGVCV